MSSKRLVVGFGGHPARALAGCPPGRWGSKSFCDTLCVAPYHPERIADLAEGDVILDALDEDRYEILYSVSGL